MPPPLVLFAGKTYIVVYTIQVERGPKHNVCQLDFKFTTLLSSTTFLRGEDEGRGKTLFPNKVFSST